MTQKIKLREKNVYIILLAVFLHIIRRGLYIFCGFSILHIRTNDQEAVGGSSVNFFPIAYRIKNFGG